MYDHVRQTSNISRTLVANKMVDDSDIVGACKARQETFAVWNLARIILDNLRNILYLPAHVIDRYAKTTASVVESSMLLFV